MNPRRILLLLTLAAFPSWAAPALMPLPQKAVYGIGSLKIDPGFRVGFALKPTARLERAAVRMIRQLERETGLPLRPVATDAAGATLRIECPETADRPDSLGQDESYQFDITTAQARLRAATVVGAMRGLQTFLQLVGPDSKYFTAPVVHIEDAPRFPWRGLLIDVTSHFMPVEVIERNLDAMEAVKLNVFHWHLTDDQGFRVESKLFPKLHQLGTEGDYYSQDEIRHLLAYAHDRGIRIVPEFDMPGHCATWLIGYPELASAPGPYSIIHTFGVYDPALDPTKEEVYQFIDKLLGEMAALFPDEYMHLGGDEVNGKHWKANAAIQAFIRERGLKDNGGLQAYFNQRVQALVAKHGKKAMGWDEVLHPNLPKDIVVESWRDHESLAKATAAGYPTLLGFGYYLDHLDLAKAHYAVDPVGGPAKNLSAADAARILGGEACMWTEFTSPETVDSRIWPKTAAIAERLWSVASVTDPADMYKRLDQVSARLDWRGVRHNLNYDSMLQRLAPQAPLQALKTLADAVEPLGINGRERAQRYSQSTPMNRLVDAARGESVPVRLLDERVQRYAASSSAPEEDEIRAAFSTWRDNDRRLGQAFSSSFLLTEAIPISADLARLGQIGIAVLSYAHDKKTIPAPELRGWQAELDRMEKPRAEVVLAAARPVRRLLAAAAR